MDSFIPKGGAVDTVRPTRPNKSPRVTREDGSHGNKHGPDQDQKDEPIDPVDIDPSHLERKSDDQAAAEADTRKTSTVSLKIIHAAMIAQATKTQAPVDADPSYKKALSAYGTYTSITAPPPDLEKTDAEGRKTKFGKLCDLIDSGMDHVTIVRGQSYDDVITQLWNQAFSTS